METANCDEVLSHLWEYLDDELPPEAAVPIAEHIAICASCRLAYSVDGALIRRVTRLEIVSLRAPDPLRRRVGLLVENA